MKFEFSSLQKPIIQAPMAGGINTPQLASAVANAGGVGSFGFAYSRPQKIRDDLAATRALTNGAINASFFIFQPVDLPDEKTQAQCSQALRQLPVQGDYDLTVPTAPFYPELGELLEPVWEQRPDILTFHFGIPPQSVIEKARALAISVGVTATSVEEAVLIEKSGVDFIVAQGIEAGGHRGIFDIRQPDLALPIDALVTLITKKVAVPVVAAGGIMTGADIKRVMNLGATAVQMGTAFLCCTESGASAAHKLVLLKEQKRGTTFTNSFSGRPAQGICNQFIRLMEDKPHLPFPIQNTLTASLRQLALKLNDGEFQSLWAGSHYHQIREMSASELMERLFEEWNS